MTLSRFNQTLQEAYSAFCTTSDFYSSEAKKSTDHINKLFLYFLSAKRRTQQINLQLLAAKYGIVLHAHQNPRWLGLYSRPLESKTLDELLDFSHEKAELEIREMERMSRPDDEIKTKSLIQTLRTMMRDYLFDINTGYLIFVSRKYSPETESLDSRPKSGVFAIH